MVPTAEASLGLSIHYLCSASTSVLRGILHHTSLAAIFPLHRLWLKTVRNCAQSHSGISSFQFSSVDLGGLNFPGPILNTWCGYQHCLLKCCGQGVRNELLKCPHKGNFEYLCFLVFLWFRATVTCSISSALPWFHGFLLALPDDGGNTVVSVLVVHMQHRQNLMPCTHLFLLLLTRKI